MEYAMGGHICILAGAQSFLNILLLSIDLQDKNIEVCLKNKYHASANYHTEETLRRYPEYAVGPDEGYRARPGTAEHYCR